MNDFVLDASVVLALHLPASAEQKLYAEKVLKLIRNGAVPAVPGLFALEVGSVLIKCRRKRLVTAHGLEVALEQIDLMNYSGYQWAYTVPGVVATAKAFMLQGYDSIYFDLAKRLRIPLASLDRGHRTACKSYGVKLLAF